VNRNADFFSENESIRIDSLNESNRIDSNRELECSTNRGLSGTKVSVDCLSVFILLIASRHAVATRDGRESIFLHPTQPNPTHELNPTHVHLWWRSVRRRISELCQETCSARKAISFCASSPCRPTHHHRLLHA